MPETLHRHPSLPVEAPANYWRQLGYTVYTDGTVGGGPHDGDMLLMLAIDAGREGAAAIAWAMAERQRRNEEQDRTSALSAEAAGLQQLAASIREVGEEEVLQKLLGRLTERTRYAVRAQLKG